MSLPAKTSRILRRHLADPYAYADRYRADHSHPPPERAAGVRKAKPKWLQNIESFVKSWLCLSLFLLISGWVVGSTWTTPLSAPWYSIVFVNISFLLLCGIIWAFCYKVIKLTSNQPIFDLFIICLLGIIILFYILLEMHDYAISFGKSVLIIWLYNLIKAYRATLGKPR